MPPDVQPLAREVLDREKQVFDKFRNLVGGKIVARRIRCHGNYHLGQVLYTGKDFLIIDFDGDPTLSLSARRIKGSPLEDVATMIRSFHYAAAEALLRLPKIGVVAPDAIATWQHAADFWQLWTSSAFLRAYLAAMAETDVLPESSSGQLDLMLQFHLLEKAIGELQAELVSRPDRVSVPLRAILELSS